MAEVTEIKKLKYEWTEPINITADTTLWLAKTLILFSQQIKFYENDGYLVSDINSENLTFTASKVIDIND